ncbi:S8 family serine peptidase [Nocardia sp. NPDC052316]|uniref:S8 family serine peptidase n=1 Tax=Nocardia sp. NPDC052316 TaxID=3364329 RepID=UPI0037CA4484
MWQRRLEGPDGVGSTIDVHGTPVAGIAAAATGNGLGIAGVSPDAQIMPVKVVENIGTYEDIGEGVRWAVDHVADVVNLSSSGCPTTSCSPWSGSRSGCPRRSPTR